MTSRGGTPSLEERFADLRADLERTLESLRAKLESSQTAPEKLTMVASLLAKLRARQFQMAVVAMIKAGKSTLINAWLGDAVLPVANLVETARIVRIRHQLDEEPKLVIGGEIVAKGTLDVEAWLRNANREARESKFANQEDVELHARFTALHGRPTEQYSFLLLDTPGTNEAGGAKALRDAIDQVLRSSDVLIYVFDYTHMKGEDEAQFLERMKQRASLLQQYANRLFVVVNKFDQMNRSGVPAEATKDYVVGVLAPIVELQREQVFVVSAERALLARLVAGHKAGPDVLFDFKQRAFGEHCVDDEQEPDESSLMAAAERMLRRSSVSALEKAVIANLYRNSARLLFESVIADTDEILGELENYANVQKATLSTSAAQSRSNIRKLRGDIADIRGRLQELEQAATSVEKEINSWIDGEFGGFRKEIEQAIDAAFAGKELSGKGIIKTITAYVTKVTSPSRNLHEVEVNTRALNKYIASYLDDSWREFRNKLEDKAYDEQKKLFEVLRKTAQPIVDAIDATFADTTGIKLKPTRVRLPESTMADLHDEIESTLSGLIVRKSVTEKKKSGTKKVLVKRGGWCDSDEYADEDVYETKQVQTARASIQQLKNFWGGKIDAMTMASVLAARAVVVDRVRAMVHDLKARVGDRAEMYFERMEASVATAERGEADRQAGILVVEALLRDLATLRAQIIESREFLESALRADTA